MKTLRILILGTLATALVSRAQNTDPGWFQVQPPAAAIQAASFQTFHANGSTQVQGVPTSPVAEAITPQIQALADGLQDDPVKIFDYVHDHIKFVLYFGSKKGAELTLLEKSGNEFDQCALLVALLSAAGYSNNVAYQFGWQEIPYDDPYGNNYDLHHWWQLTLNNTAWTNTTYYISGLASTRGYPQDSSGYTMVYQDTGDAINGYTNNFLMQRVWVALTVGATTYQLDPAFKISLPVPVLSGFSLTNAMGSGTVSNDLLSAAAGTNNANYAQNLSESAVRSKLTAYATNLLNYIQNNAPTARMQDILGGWQIVPANNPIDYTNSIRFPSGTVNGMSTIGWTYEPTNLMSTLSVAFVGTSYQWLIPQLQGQRLSLTFSNNGFAQLWLEDNSVASGTTSGHGTTNVVLSVTHPIGTWDAVSNTLIFNPANFANHTVTNTYQSTNATYALIYAFEPDWGWLEQRENKLDTYLQEGFTNGSRQVTSETLNVMGLNWMLQTAQVGLMMAPQLGMLPQYFHRIGRMAQEGGRGYYVDVYMQFTGEYPSGGNDAAHIQLQNSQFDLWSFFASSLEHGIIEQMQSTNIVGASTVKMLEIANTNGQAVYLANSANWNSIKSSLINYGTTLNQIYTNYISQGYYVLMPANGSNHVTSVAGSWAGYGYEVRQATNGVATVSGMIIAGDYHGGYSSVPSLPDTYTTDLTAVNNPTYYNPTPPYTPAPATADPVDTADDTFQVETTDLSLGQAEPRGITLSRYYNGTRRNSNPAGMADGWIHNYAITANNLAAPQAGLGVTTPAQASSMLAATAAAIAMYNGGQPDAKNWLTTALIAKWAVDQITKNGVSVNLGKDTLQFVRQANGTFTPPPASTATLTQTNSAYSMLMRHGNQFKFNTNGLLTSIVDQYGQSLSLTYTNNWVSKITDWTNRQFTFTYSGTPLRLTSVSDGTRSVSYGYATTYNSQGDLVSFTDAEGKTCHYIYDTNHQITATLDALNQMVVSNVYDLQGHITTQSTEGAANKMWLIHWTGWQTTEFDPAGGQQIYYYDDLTRLIAVQDALGNTNQIFYDGQNQIVTNISPLNEISRSVYDGNNNVIQTIDPLNNTNQFVYDGNNNLVETLDPLGNPATFGYNAQFSLTGQTNGAGDWVNYTYNANGTLATSANSGGTTQYGYDSFGQLKTTTYPNNLGGVTNINSYLGDVTNRIDGRGFAVGFQYNNRRQLTSTTAPTNLTVKVGYDAVGNTTTNTDARGNTTTGTWSPTRHLIATILPTTPQGTPVITNGYDSRDWLALSADPLGNPTLYTNDVAGRLIAVADPVKRTTRFGYDNDGHQLTSTNGGNETNCQTWDARGKLIQLTDGAGHIVLRSYDAAGNQILLTNRNTKRWQFYFDKANRLTNTVTPLNRKTVLTFNHQGLVSTITDPSNQLTSLYYDDKGRLTNRTDNVASTIYGFDANDNRTGITESGKANSWTYDAYNRVSSYQDVSGNLIQYRYDANGNLTNLVYPGGKNVFYAYDSLNRMTNVTDWSGRKSGIGYDLDSRITSITRPNGSYRTLGYDAAGQTTNIMEQMSNGLPIAIFRCNWTNTGTMASEFSAPLPHSSNAPTRLMGYDADNRLTSFQGPTMGSYQTVGTDADGNTINGPLTNDTFVPYSYDARNRLLNAGGVTNTYDAANNRIGQSYGTNAAVFVVNPNAKLPQVLMRIKNGVTNYYIYGPGLLYQITETATATNTLTYHYDYRGSTIALSADNGLVTDRIEYSLYGLTTYRVGASDTPFLFNGRFGVMTDPNGLLYMRARYYNPYLCRFINPDPSGFSGGLNFYAYANGNPISYLDPFGLGAYNENAFNHSWVTPTENAVPSSMTVDYTANNGFTPTLSVEYPYFNVSPTANPANFASVLLLGVPVIGEIGDGIILGGDLTLGAAEDTTTVGRWMSQSEYDAMESSGTVQAPLNGAGATHVTVPPDPAAFTPQPSSGSVFAEFDVPNSQLRISDPSQGWGRVFGPDSIEARLAARQGLPVPTQMPPAFNIQQTASQWPR